MKVPILDLSRDLALSERAVTAALATAKATEKRAEMLLALAKSSPEILLKARGIYIRAGARVRRLQSVLDKSTARMEGAS
jgi:hypothetical protein